MNMVAVGGSQPKPVCAGGGGACLCAYVKLRSPNSAIDQEFRDGRAESRGNATSSA